jgi:hypothetical protein
MEILCGIDLASMLANGGHGFSYCVSAAICFSSDTLYDIPKSLCIALQITHRRSTIAGNSAGAYELDFACVTPVSPARSKLHSHGAMSKVKQSYLLLHCTSPRVPPRFSARFSSKLFTYGRPFSTTKDAKIPQFRNRVLLRLYVPLLAD